MSLSDLFLIASGICFLGCLLLASAGAARRSATLLWWGVGYGIGGFGMGAVAAAYIYHKLAFAAVGSGLVLSAYSLLWIGTGVLSKPRPARYWVIPLGLIWAVLAQIPPLAGSETLRMITFGPLVAGVLLALAWDAYRLPGRFAARLPLAALAAMHVVFSVVRSVALALDATPAAHRAWLFATPVEAIFYLFSDAFLIINLVRSVQEGALAREAYTDFLTGVLNRRRFTHCAEEALKRGPCTLLMLDLDYFKQVNDRFGHAAGDAVLQAVGEVCRQEVPQADLVGRLGGDEFAILLSGTADRAQAIAGRISAAFAQKSEAMGWPTGISIGLAHNTDVRTTLADLTAQADAQLYDAKARRPTLERRAGAAAG